MRIGINGRFLVAKRTGVQRAAYNLVRTLFEVDRSNEYILFTGRSQLENPEWDYPNVTIVPSFIKEGENFRNHLWEQFELPRLAKKYKVDILHSPANMAPLIYKRASIVHIHDLCFVVNPQWYSYLFHRVYNFIIPRLARKSTVVVTNSNNSRNDLLQFCDVDSEKVRLIYWAVDDTFHIVPKSSSLDKIKEGDYILYVGSLEPRKNISSLIKAYETLRLRNPDIKTKLVLIGGESPLFADAQLKIKSYKNDIIFKGFVPDDMLRAYYRKAKVVAYPSLYEGFGLPPLEAMASGSPVVTSNTSSLPEVVGDAALLVSPYDIDQIAATLARVIRSPQLQENLRQLGQEQVRKFNWYRVARNILGVYYEVYSGLTGKDSESHLSLDTWKDLVIKEKQFLEQSRLNRLRVQL
ncbi:glycosyltransferase family 4 protein [Pseudobacteriovorax antillogorgiicola]|uniref:Glycosyltransferase involved in cell wall bisynthesis n=1 Tax=Pseudobacteriovorax antillogorgiicola TaxID=1513793 RepID=A0A1Y6B2K8_9BACT|nr:glycosyltransferase family 1 protein [Pseudobacteriovorax antillogorgiicola]TCS59449.1 glycosyltransferase involved in cell wall biosynthesis [Pseudobacteriovorax antillogorgiicola]SME88223.1 Glycosyltransferase involved in cell wall bisynthesis [Pseudobacteriovorax antillogorgiicola]